MFYQIPSSDFVKRKPETTLFCRLRRSFTAYLESSLLHWLGIWILGPKGFEGISPFPKVWSKLIFKKKTKYNCIWKKNKDVWRIRKPVIRTEFSLTNYPLKSKPAFYWPQWCELASLSIPVCGSVLGAQHWLKF